LDTAAFAFDNLDVDDDGVAGLKFRNGLAGGKSSNFFLLDNLDQVHRCDLRAPALGASCSCLRVRRAHTPKARTSPWLFPGARTLSAFAEGDCALSALGGATVPKADWKSAVP